MIKKYLETFLEQFAFPAEACLVLKQEFKKIQEDKNADQKFSQILHCYMENMECDFTELLQRMHELAKKTGIHEYTGNMLLLICLSEKLKEYYQEQQVDERIWYNSMLDLKWKLDECWCVYGIWGTFVPDWYAGFYQMNRFALGRLQFETCELDVAYEKDGMALRKGDTVINVHIPRTGSRLDRESVSASYKKAAEFFRNRGLTESVVFVCHSWLLFPRNKEILDQKSNLYQFMEDFDIVQSGEDQDYSEVWRLFDCNYQGDVDQLPQDTSLRRAYAEWIRKDEKIGWGYGIYVYRK